MLHGVEYYFLNLHNMAVSRKSVFRILWPPRTPPNKWSNASGARPVKRPGRQAGPDPGRQASGQTRRLHPANTPPNKWSNARGPNSRLRRACGLQAWQQPSKGVFDQLFGGVTALVVRARALNTGICHMASLARRPYLLTGSQRLLPY